MQKVIGTTTTYCGDEHRYLSGHQLCSVGVFIGAASPDHDPDLDAAYVTDDDELARIGGVTAADRIEVKPWIEQAERFSFVSSDPRATDLDRFSALTDGGAR